MAISPQLPRHSLAIHRHLKLAFPVLSDPENRVARAWGLVFALPPELRQGYKQLGNIDLQRYNGDPSWELPIPGSFVVGTDGRIRYASADPDYTRRPEPAEMLAVLNSPADR